MQHVMRRKDRAVNDPAEIAAFLEQEQLMRIGFADQDGVYIVPLNYGYTCENDHYTFWFHGAQAGRKYDLARKNPTVGFEIDGAYRVIPAESACGYSAAYQSVIGQGVFSIVTDPQEKIKGLTAVMRQVTKQTEWSFPEQQINAVAVFRLDVSEMSCKRRSDPAMLKQTQSEV